MTIDALFGDIPGQERALTELRHAISHPVHAYLLVGPTGTGKRRAARGFSAALLCPDGGCGHCTHCRRVESGNHPDLIIAERQGVSYRVDELHALTAAAQRRPLEAHHTVIIIPDAEMLGTAAAALLKTLEEPPATTVFILLADDLPREMATIRSRCVEIVFAPLTASVIATWLEASGVEPGHAATIAEGAAGDAERARLLVDDPGFAERLERWRRVPRILDGLPSTAMALALELHASLDHAVAPLEARHAEELATLHEQAKSIGERGLTGRREIVDRHKRAERRYRTTELRAGLGVLARAYRDAMVASLERDEVPTARRCARGIDAITKVATSLPRNPRQPLALEHLLVALSDQT